MFLKIEYDKLLNWVKNEKYSHHLLKYFIKYKNIILILFNL